MTLRASESFIVHGFQAFYYELLRQKEKALSSFFEPNISSNQGNEDNQTITIDQTQNDELIIADPAVKIDAAIVDIQKKIISIISSVCETISEKSKIHPRFISDIKYIMVVLSDETFININWNGSKIWRFSLLEKQIFNTESAGDNFFAKLDEIITDYSNEEMAFIYLMALSLGFKGKFRDITTGEDRIIWYKDRLFAILNTKPSRLFFPGRPSMINQCYEYTMHDNFDSTLPDVRFWSICIISIIFLYIIISYFVWFNITAEINDVLQKIMEQTKQGHLV